MLGKSRTASKDPISREHRREHLADWAPSASGLCGPGRLDLLKRDECFVELVVDYFVDLHYLVSHALNWISYLHTRNVLVHYQLEEHTYM